MREQRVLPTVVSENYTECIYANGAIVSTIANAELYKVLKLDLESGFSSLLGFIGEESPEKEEMKRLLSLSVPRRMGNQIVLTSPDGSDVYVTIECPFLFPDGWEVRVERITPCTYKSIGLVIFHPDSASEVANVRAFTNEDFREADEVRCEVMSGKSFMHPEKTRCARGAGHIGKHQGFNENSDYYYHEWSEENGQASGNPMGKFGFKVICTHCKLVNAGSASGEKICFTCNYWLNQAQDRKDAFVIDGVHYRKGQGGFSGHRWNLTRSNGSTWSGELWMQGEIPTWFRHLFPDNASFIESQ